VCLCVWCVLCVCVVFVCVVFGSCELCVCVCVWRLCVCVVCVWCLVFVRCVCVCVVCVCVWFVCVYVVCGVWCVCVCVTLHPVRYAICNRNVTSSPCCGTPTNQFVSVVAPTQCSSFSVIPNISIVASQHHTSCSA